MCSSSGIATVSFYYIQLHFPDYPHVLSDEIQDRKAKKVPFAED